MKNKIMAIALLLGASAIMNASNNPNQSGQAGQAGLERGDQLTQDEAARLARHLERLQGLQAARADVGAGERAMQALQSQNLSEADDRLIRNQPTGRLLDEDVIQAGERRFMRRMMADEEEELQNAIAAGLLAEARRRSEEEVERRGMGRPRIPTKREKLLAAVAELQAIIDATAPSEPSESSTRETSDL